MELPRAISVPEGIGTEEKDIHWLKENIPCQQNCPAHTDIPGYLGAIYRGEYDEAYKINLRDNVFPAVLGRVCARPCEDSCRHGWDGLGEPVSICFSKRSSADFKSGDRVLLDPLYEESGKTVAIVGGGPAGLTAARNLALLGHKVTVYERHSRPGGMMIQGIPEFRLPRRYIEREIDQIRMQGVEIICNAGIGPDMPLQKLVDDYDAVVLACGTFRPNYLRLEGKELDGIEHGLPWLLNANEFKTATVGEKCLVIGGGFTAMDCARTAFRLGAKETRVCYRRSQNEMLVTPGEVEELDHENIPMDFMVGPKKYLGKEGKIESMQFSRNEMGEPDESGRRRPMEVKGSEFEFEADTILLATGQFPDTSWIDKSIHARIVGDDDWLLNSYGHDTAIENLFIAGDFSTGAASLIDAIGHAKTTALSVDEYLMGKKRLKEVALVEDGRNHARERSFDMIERKPMPSIPVSERSFEAEVDTGFKKEQASDETSRCYLCHYKYEIDNTRCIQCDQCIQVIPRPQCIVRTNTVHEDEAGRIVGFEEEKGTTDYGFEYFINQKDCIRCNACLEVCPTECITVQKVTRCTVTTESKVGDMAYI